MTYRSMTNRSKWQRRAVIAGGAVGLFSWVKGLPLLLSSDDTGLEFETLDGLAPFRRLLRSGPATSAGGAVFAGIESSEPLSPDAEMMRQTVKDDPCAAFFGAQQTGAVPVAMFSDFKCPICKTMNGRLAELQEKTGDSFRIIRHELPLLGAASRTASKAVLAADIQGKYLEMHEILNRTPAVTDAAFVGSIAKNIGLDSNQLLRDMNSDEVEQKLRMSRAIADVFGFYGTPAFAVGRTVFLGAVPTLLLTRLITQEADGPCLQGQ